MSCFIRLSLVEMSAFNKNSAFVFSVKNSASLGSGKLVHSIRSFHNTSTTRTLSSKRSVVNFFFFLFTTSILFIKTGSFCNSLRIVDTAAIASSAADSNSSKSSNETTVIFFVGSCILLTSEADSVFFFMSDVIHARNNSNKVGSTRSARALCTTLFTLPSSKEARCFTADVLADNLSKDSIRGSKPDCINLSTPAMKSS
mmetsp:Transcript_32897/g.38618  ORF Transcript_32897/g.38618 Transcript_32897/m.38618 type:complete len:200 (-) Transcript_32897:532-1131(-)